MSTIRWDVWRTNQSLQDYYTRLGIKQLRATQVPGRFSGVLYEVSFQLSQDLNAVTTIAPRGPLHVLDSHLNPAPQVHRSEIDPFDQYPQPHTHTVTGLQVPCLATPTQEAPRDLVVAGDDARRTLLYNPGPGWRLRNPFSHEITAWADQPDIQAGQSTPSATRPRTTKAAARSS